MNLCKQCGHFPKPDHVMARIQQSEHCHCKCHRRKAIDVPAPKKKFETTTNAYGEEVYACQNCGGATIFHPNIMTAPASQYRCNNCWEIEHRLDEYLRAPAGRDFVRAALDKAGNNRR